MAERLGLLVADKERSATIHGLQQRDAATFARDRDSRLQGGLGLTPGGLRYLIPPSVFTQAFNPEQVQLRIVDNTPGSVDFFIVEQGAKKLFDRDAALAGKRKLRSRDPMRVEATDYTKSGLIEPQDYIFMRAALEERSQRELWVSWFLQHPDFEHTHTASDFYHRLHTVAIDLGFRFIAGENWHNRDFYTEKLGRHRLDQLPSHVKEEIHKNHGGDMENEEVVTVDVLHEEDLDSAFYRSNYTHQS